MRLGTGRTWGCILGKLLGNSMVGNEESCLFKKRGWRGLERLQVVAVAGGG